MITGGPVRLHSACVNTVSQKVQTSKTDRKQTERQKKALFQANVEEGKTDREKQNGQQRHTQRRLELRTRASVLSDSKMDLPNPVQGADNDFDWERVCDGETREHCAETRVCE